MLSLHPRAKNEPIVSVLAFQCTKYLKSTTLPDLGILSFSDKALWYLLPGLSCAVCGGDRDYDSDPHESSPNFKGMCLPRFDSNLYVLRRIF